MEVYSGGMAGLVGEKSGVGTSLEGNLNGQRCQGNGSPSYWDTDDADEGEKPSELYGKYTWKIYKFSQINKRELRSSVFDVGGYKWYILIYPQGCDVSNHLSLFLCVANHDKLLPGWNHFVQFTIAVVNKDPKKSKYSDTLHRFWKKEHDWGWKKFMELSKLSDGFIDADALIIKAQVQVIRERSDWPFRCLDRQYQRELVRVYLSNVEHICRKTVDDKRKFLRTYYEDKAGWSSLSAFWLGMDQNARRHISREKTVVILKTMVKLFFVEKEVVSTLLMDFLYSGLKALEAQSKCSNRRVKLLGKEEMPVPVVYVERDLFALIDDTNLLLKRVHMGLLPAKDSKVPQNRIKEASAGEELDKDSIAQDEKHLTELGRSTVEIFVIDHIFNNKIVPAYEKAAAKKSKRASSSRKKKAS